MPGVVVDAPRVGGVHQVFVDEAVDSSVVGGVLGEQWVGVRERLVYVPVSGGGLGVALGVALGRGREFGVPVLVSGGGLGDVWGERVVAFPGGGQVVLPREFVVEGGHMAQVLRAAVGVGSRGGEGEVPRVLVDAVRGFPVWGGDGDCVVRAGWVLTALGVGGAAADAQGSGAGWGSVAAVAARLGGVFAAASMQDVARLAVGHSTVVWVRDVVVPQHVVVVHRSHEDAWWLVQTQVRDVAGRVVRFDPRGRDGGGLGRSILVPVQASGGLLSVGAGGRVFVGDPVVGPAGVDALVDPALTPRAGMMPTPAWSAPLAEVPAISRRSHRGQVGHPWMVYDAPFGYSPQHLDRMVMQDFAASPDSPALVNFAFAGEQQMQWALDRGMYVVYLKLDTLETVLAHQSMREQVLDAAYFTNTLLNLDAVTGFIESQWSTTATNTLDTTMTDLLTGIAAPHGSFDPMITTPDPMMMNLDPMMAEPSWQQSGQSDPYQMTHTPWPGQNLLSGQWATPSTDTTWTSADTTGAWDDPRWAQLTANPPTATASTSTAPETTTHHRTDTPNITGPMSMFEHQPPTHHLPTHDNEDHDSLFDGDEDHDFLPDSHSEHDEDHDSRQQQPAQATDEKRKSTAEERANVIKQWVAIDPTNHQNAIPPISEKVNINGQKYSIGRILHTLTKIGLYRDEPVVRQALRDAGFEVSNDGKGRMHIVGFRRMTDDETTDFRAAYFEWVTEMNEEGELVNISKMPLATLKLDIPNKPGEQVYFGQIMHNMKTRGHPDPSGEIARMLQEMSGFVLIHRTGRGFDGFKVPGAPKRNTGKLSPQKEQAFKERIEAVELWVGNGENAGKVPTKSETVLNEAGKEHKVGQMFARWRVEGLVFHEGLFKVLEDNDFKPERDGSKMYLPRDKGMLVSTAEKAAGVEDLFAAYDLWVEGDPKQRAKKIPGQMVKITLPGGSIRVNLGKRMDTLVQEGLVDPGGTIGERLRERGLHTDTRGDKTFLVRLEGAPAEVGSVSAATQETAGVGRSLPVWAQASGSGMPPVAVQEPVVLPPGVTQRDGQPGLYWVGPLSQDSTAGKWLAAAGDTVLEANPQAPVIMLSRAPEEHRRDEDLRALRRLVQQFTLKQQSTLVITTDPVTEPLKQIAAAYSFDILHLAAGSTTHASTSTTPRANLDTIWRTTTTAGTTTDATKNFTQDLLTRTIGALPIPEPVTPALAKLLLTPKAKDKISLLHEYRAHLHTSQVRAELDTIITTNDNDHWFSSTRPLLNLLDTPEHTPVFLAYQTAPPENTTQRHQILLSQAARDIPVHERVTLIHDTGHPTSSAEAAMTAVNILFTHGEDHALRYIHNHTADLNTTARYNWVDAIAALHTQHPDKTDQLTNISAAIYNCGPHQNDPH
ncbi:hypothetical protein [Micromonospora sp. NPDC049102]|uniref:hypothetical protein n=1 Tax=Micromonospora sp. NPDC049102 TaxID=3364265 RepID=UPI003713E107